MFAVYNNVSIRNRWHRNLDRCRRAYFTKGLFKGGIAKERGVTAHQREQSCYRPSSAGWRNSHRPGRRSPQKRAIWRGAETLARVIANPRQPGRERSREINTWPHSAPTPSDLQALRARVVHSGQPPGQHRVGKDELGMLKGQAKDIAYTV